MTNRVDSLTIDTILQDWQHYPDVVIDVCHDLLDARGEVQRLQVEAEGLRTRAEAAEFQRDAWVREYNHMKAERSIRVKFGDRTEPY